MLETKKAGACTIDSLKSEGLLSNGFKITQKEKDRVNYLLSDDDSYINFKSKLKGDSSFIHVVNQIRNEIRNSKPHSYSHQDLQKLIKDKKYLQLQSTLEEIFLEPVDLDIMNKIVNKANIKNLMEYHTKHPNICIKACINHISFIY